MAADHAYAGVSPQTTAASERLADSPRQAAADRIASAAWTLEGHAENLPGGERVAQFAHSTADQLTTASDYIREHDLNAMLEDAKRVVRNHPVPAVLGAAVLGFLLAKAVSRN